MVTAAQDVTLVRARLNDATRQEPQEQEGSGSEERDSDEEEEEDKPAILYVSMRGWDLPVHPDTGVGCS